MSMPPNHYALWIDHAQAYIFKYTASGIEETRLTHDMKNDRQDNQVHHQKLDKFYHELAAKMQDAQELMIMGPGVAKDEFKHHLEKHNHSKLAKAVVGVQTMASHPTKADMKKKASEFFKNFHQWTANY